MKFLKTVAVAGLLAASSYAISAVTFDPGTGVGFVGKGDVQLAFGWNNQALQANAAGVTFSYNVTDSYTATCTWVTGEGTRGERTHNVDHTTMTRVNGIVAYEARTRNQITGFNLTGFGEMTSVGTVPVVGGPCPGNAGNDGVWSSVTANGSTGGLYVNYGGTSVRLQ
jgi:hypothetical protein